MTEPVYVLAICQHRATSVCTHTRSVELSVHHGGLSTTTVRPYIDRSKLLGPKPRPPQIYLIGQTRVNCSVPWFFPLKASVSLFSAKSTEQAAARQSLLLVSFGMSRPSPMSYSTGDISKPDKKLKALGPFSDS